MIKRKQNQLRVVKLKSLPEKQNLHQLKNRGTNRRNPEGLFFRQSLFVSSFHAYSSRKNIFSHCNRRLQPASSVLLTREINTLEIEDDVAEPKVYILTKPANKESNFDNVSRKF